MFLSCGKLLNSYLNVFFVHFRSFFVLFHGPERVTVHPPPMKDLDQVFLLIRPSPTSKVATINQKADGLPILGHFKMAAIEIWKSRFVP